MLLNNHVKQSPIIGLAGMGGGIASYVFLSAAGGYEIARSLRFNPSDSASLTKTFGATGSQTTYTFSFWLKKTNNSSVYQNILIDNDSSSSQIRINDTTGGFELRFAAAGASAALTTNRKFRDPSAWYHIVCVYDSTNATSSDRMRIYVNGVRETSFLGETQPTQNLASAFITNGHTYTLGYFASNVALDGYLADVWFVDGQALEPTEFGEFDATTGVWNPKRYTGTATGNSFHLPFTDTTSTTTLGYDDSGNNNNWTLNNISNAEVESGFKAGYYTGTGSATALPVSTVPHPDFVWIKSRSGASHALYDSIRGFTKRLYSNATNSEYTYGSSILTPTGTGFNLTTSDADHNTLSTNYVAWCWDATGVSQTNYDPASTGATVDYIGNTNTGFSIVKCASPNNTQPRAHGCGAAPDFIIAKAYNSGSEQWHIYHSALGRTYYGTFTATKFNSSDQWGSQEPDSTYFYVKALTASGANYSTGMIYYLWAAKAGYSAFGSYTGTGSSGNSVTGLGFKPAMVIIKSSSHDVDWIIEDKNITGTLYPNTADGEYGSGLVQFDDDGFTLTNTTTNSNALNYTYIYAAFAEQVDIDSLLDSPSNDTDTGTGIGGEIVGNYATWNPLKLNTNGSLANGNLDWSSSTGGGMCAGTIGVSSGKWYWEVTVSGGTNCGIGVFDPSAALTTYIENSTLGIAYYGSAGSVFYYGGSTAYGSSFGSGDVIGVALDLDNGKVYFSKNGTWQNSGDPAAQTNPARTGLSGVYAPAIDAGASNAHSASLNTGQRDFAYDAPTGFKALNTAALPTPTIARPDQYVGVTTYTGTGLSNQVVSGLNFQSDLIWIKSRTGAYDHRLFDSVRGFGSGNALYPNDTVAEGTYSVNDGALSVSSTGWTFTTAGARVNDATNYVGWAWKAGGNSNTFNVDGTGYSTASAAGLTAGSITPTGASVGTTQGFSIVTYAGNNTAGASISHGLDQAPQFIIVKSKSDGYAWQVGHTSIGWTKRLYLNTTAASETNTIAWNDTAPTSTVFTLGDSAVVNGPVSTYVAYCWHNVPGLQKFGSYTGNGDVGGDGPFIELGFQPALVIVKAADTISTEPWCMVDNERKKYNPNDNVLFSNLGNIESTGSGRSLDLLSNGFKVRTNNAWYNQSSVKYIYAAWAETPFSTQARAR